MNIDFNTIRNYSLTFIDNNLSSNLNSQQKIIVAIASTALVSLAILFMMYRCCFKAPKKSDDLIAKMSEEIAKLSDRVSKNHLAILELRNMSSNAEKKEEKSTTQIAKELDKHPERKDLLASISGLGLVKLKSKEESDKERAEKAKAKGVKSGFVTPAFKRQVSHHEFLTGALNKIRPKIKDDDTESQKSPFTDTATPKRNEEIESPLSHFRTQDSQ